MILKLHQISIASSILILYLLLYPALNPNCKRSDKNIMVISELNKYFDECGVKGSIIIYDLKKEKWFTNDTLSIYDKTLPASTFKIPNLLIALEIGAIEDEHEVIPFVRNPDTVRYGYRPGTYRDMTVQEAFEASAVWVFLELADRIGTETYQRYLKEIEYGNQLLASKNKDFWNFGKLGISPYDQVQFLKKLYEGKLPFTKENIEIVKEVMVTELRSNYTVRGKTGWTREDKMNIGWWIGYVEKEDEVYLFATRIFQEAENSANFGVCRKKITEQVFNHMKFLD